MRIHALTMLTIAVMASAGPLPLCKALQVGPSSAPASAPASTTTSAPVPTRLPAPTSAPTTSAAAIDLDVPDYLRERYGEEVVDAAIEILVDRKIATVVALVYAENGEETAATQTLARMSVAEEVSEMLGPSVSFAGVSGVVGAPVPKPDPAKPVDYLAWLVAQTKVNGVDGAKIVDDASKKYVAWNGVEKLYKAARNGDAKALASPEIAAWVKKNAAALAEFRKLADAEYRGNVNVSDAEVIIQALLPQNPRIRELSRLAVITARLEAQRGDTEAALACLIDTLVIGGKASNGPMVIDNLVGMAIREKGARGILDLYSTTDDADIDYTAVARELDRRPIKLRPFAEALQTERAFVLNLIQRLFEWDAKCGEYRVRDDAAEFFYALMDEGDEPLTTDRLSTIFGLSIVGFEDTVVRTNAFFDILTSGARTENPLGNKVFRVIIWGVQDPVMRWRLPLAYHLTPDYARHHHLATANATMCNGVRLVAALKAYRQRHGEYPESLEVFGDAEMTMDLFAENTPLIYRREGADFRLYSRGIDAVDDGGTKHNASGDEGDMVIWAPPPKS